jgi:predicted ferric reductase
MEWHSFATITEHGKKGFSVVVSRAGDWTTKMISNPPTHIWKRGVPTYGVMNVSTIFNRVVLVATGSGIGPIAPALFRGTAPARLLWTAPNVRETFGDKLVNQIIEVNPEAVIWGESSTYHLPS